MEERGIDMQLEYTEILIRILIAIFAGGIVGFEREQRGRDAGFRTHLLVSVGACIFTLIELEGVERVIQFAVSNEDIRQSVNVSVHRLTAQIVTGIGFLGAGTIIVTKRSIRGLTTAASIWVCAALGMAAGYGYQIIVVVGVVAIMLVLLDIKRIFSFPHVTVLTVTFRGQEGLAGKLEDFLKAKGVKVIEMSTKTSLTERGLWHDIDFHVDSSKIPSTERFLHLIQELGDFTEVTFRSEGDEY